MDQGTTELEYLNLALENNELTLQIKGIDCATCVNTIENGVTQLSGVTACELNFSTQKMTISGDISQDLVIRRVRELGYEVEEPGSDQSVVAPERNINSFLSYIWSQGETRFVLLGALLILPGLIFGEILGREHLLMDISSLAALVIAGYPIARSGWRAVRLNHEININVLMTIAGVGAVIIGAYTEAGMIMVLFALGEALESYTVERARYSIRSMMETVPTHATLLLEKDNSVREEQVNIDQLEIGDRVLVKPGERIPMDGRVLDGASHVNQAPITGESQLVEKTPGAEVFASSTNGEGVLKIEVTRISEDNTINRMVKLVSEAQEKRAPTQRFIDRFAKVYTPAVVIFAILVAVIPPLLFGGPFLNPDPQTHGWLYRGLALLVISCPCALVISTPVSLISAIVNAARKGIIIKGGTYLETLSQVKAFAFDKTGTLTRGKPSVVAVQSTDCTNLNTPPPSKSQLPNIHDADVLLYCDSCNDIIALANAVEQRSEHPLAQAIVSESSHRGLQDRYPPAEMVTALIGEGITGDVTGHEVMLGSHRYFDAHIPHSQEHCTQADDYVKQGYTSIFVSRDGEYVGTITVADTVRESSRTAVSQLKQAGIDEVILLTGDDERTARLVGEQVGMTEIRSELMPEDKLTAIAGLQARFKKVAMVGDGINDAPALAAADVGIAIGGANRGTAQAMETADVTLMSDDLRHLPFIYQLSNWTMRTIYANIALSLGVKLAFLILVLLGYGTMWMAVLADVGITLVVTLNGMRLLNRGEIKI